MSLRILIVTDAWHPQVNGVVRTLSTVGEEVRALGHDVAFLTPADFQSVPCPTYPEIRLAVARPRRVRDWIDAFRPTAIHIATEGPLGFVARRYALARKLPFTTSFHTRFPEYIWARARVPVSWSYSAIRRFHQPAASVMVPTQAVINDLEGRRFRNLRLWNRGVDTTLFQPGPPPDWANGLPRPIMLNVGRVAVEKSLPDFLKLDLPGTKVIVGDGPARDQLQADFSEALFLGPKFGAELADAYRAADVFVFPSRTDTFGLVMLEALASGVPVAAYPVMGPVDVIGGSPAGVLHDDLGTAISGALAIDTAVCRAYAEQFSWSACARQFLGYLAPFG